MANNEFDNIKQFIEGFTRVGLTPENYTYDGTIFGIDFEYKNRIYRISRDPTGDEENLRIKYKKGCEAYIHFYELIKDQYPSEMAYSLDQYNGFFESVDELLDVGSIDGIPLRDIIASEETTILAID